MDIRLAKLQDLPALKAMYMAIVEDMEQRCISIWDEQYPCEYLKEDIDQKRFYVLVEQGMILSAFALCQSTQIDADVKWPCKETKGLYLERLGVHPAYAHKGIGGRALWEAKQIAKAKKAEYIRLFVVDYNEPAICFYTKNGFQRVEGVYQERIDDDLILNEIAFACQC